MQYSTSLFCSIDSKNTVASSTRTCLSSWMDKSAPGDHEAGTIEHDRHRRKRKPRGRVSFRTAVRGRERRTTQGLRPPHVRDRPIRLGHRGTSTRHFLSATSSGGRSTYRTTTTMSRENPSPLSSSSTSSSCSPSLVMCAVVRQSSSFVPSD
jgi:hypothetical protein